MVLVGAASLLRSIPRVSRIAALALVLVGTAAIVLHVARVHVFPEYRVFGPELGLVAVVLGFVISAAGAWILPWVAEAQPPPG